MTDELVFAPGPGVNSPNGDPQLGSDELFQGFARVYDRIRSSGLLAYSANLNVHTLMELLVARGILTVEEVEQRRDALKENLDEDQAQQRLGVMLAADDRDKYEIPADELPDIDCEDRIPLCKAACCTLRWALGEQDLFEGHVQWDIRRPYVNRVRADDGYCVHCAPDTKACGVYAMRPSVCRQYDCRNDERIWADFENRVVSPGLEERLGTLGTMERLPRTLPVVQT